MKQKNDFSPIQKRASELGVFIIAVDVQAMIVLADTASDYVTWCYQIDHNENCRFENGNYFRKTHKSMDLSDARKDYQHRIAVELGQTLEAIS